MSQRLPLPPTEKGGELLLQSRPRCAPNLVMILQAGGVVLYYPRVRQVLYLQFAN
jgi:hypothetical protein